MYHTCGVVAVIINRCCIRGCKPLDLGPSHLTIIVNLHGGKKFIPFSMGYGTIFLSFILESILHRCTEFILSGTSSYIFVELFVADVSIFLVALPSPVQRWRQVIGQVIHLVYTINILEYSDPESFQNIIVNIFDMLLKDAPMFFQTILPNSTHSYFSNSMYRL